ncbi:conjugative pilus assembly domain protein [Orientia tsutsugamushi str. UT76]|nr:conjugative pilus assembly domain protein [Orientia tsutsugamushi str. UT76]
MNPLAIMLIMWLLNYLSIELATANSLPTGFLWYNDKHGHELDESAANSKLIQQLMIIESRN